MTLIADIADAVVTDLTAADFSLEFTPSRAWLAVWSLEDLETLRVTVLPGPAQFEPLDRRRDNRLVATDVAVQQKIDPSDNDAVDALVGLMEEIVAHFRNRSLAADATNIVCVKRGFVPGSEAAVALDDLDQLRTFTGVARITWQARQ